MTGPIGVTLYHKPKPEGGWQHLDGFDLTPGATPRIGEALRLRGKLWRIADVIWDFESMRPDGSVGYSVDLKLELGTE